MVWLGLAWIRMVWHGLAWFGMAWRGLLWFGVVWYGLAWFGPVEPGCVNSVTAGSPDPAVTRLTVYVSWQVRASRRSLSTSDVASGARLTAFPEATSTRGVTLVTAGTLDPAVIRLTVYRSLQVRV